MKQGLAPSGTSILAHKCKYGNYDTQVTITSANSYVAFEGGEALPPSSPHEHHHISVDTHHKINLLHWLSNNQDDPALEACDFLRTKLKCSYIILGFPASPQGSSYWPLTQAWFSWQ